jgi:hypothetical protein
VNDRAHVISTLSRTGAGAAARFLNLLDQRISRTIAFVK